MLRLLILYCLFLVSFSYKSISINPGGLKGFYTLGICKYIKENYCLDEYYLYGSSAGSWNALYLTLPLDDNNYIDKIITIKKGDFKNLYELENKIKNIILEEKYPDTTSLNKKCNICFSQFNRYRFKKVIKNEFHDLNDMLECCIASSHLPIISNKMFFYCYQKQKCVDGGLFRTNYPKNIKPNLVLSHKMFNNKQIVKYSRANHLNIERLIYEGYSDARKYRNYFDIKFL
tara:strand:+ start:106 stop:798 length:693 start_codon:yes stop_codon:yes gene_type:complete